MTLSTYELAKLRLNAWHILKGWGKEDGTINHTVIPHGMEARKRAADLLVEWAISPMVPKSDV